MGRTYDTTSTGLASLLLLWREEGRRQARDREMAALGFSQADIRDEREREERWQDKTSTADQ